MTQLLIVGSAILAAGPFEVTTDAVKAKDAIYPKHVIAGYSIVEGDLKGKQPAECEWIAGAVAVRAPRADVLSAFDREAAQQIDDRIAAIYAAPQRFIKEYEDREKQARDFVASGYAGTVPPRIVGYATPRAFTAKQAADDTIAQADALRTALGMLADLRMRKYEVAAQTTIEAKQAVLADVLGKVSAIGAQFK